MRLLLLCFLPFILSLQGCPPDGTDPDAPPATPGEGTGAGSGLGSGSAAGSGSDPLAGSVFSQDELFEIYAAEAAGEPRRSEVLREHRLLDPNGQEVPARARAYERALQRFASRDPAGWSAFLETLPR